MLSPCYLDFVFSFLIAVGCVVGCEVVIVWHVHQHLHLLVSDILLLLQERAVLAPALIDAIVDTLVTYTFTTPIMEPPVRAGTHRGAGSLALVPGHALGHVGHRAVDRHQGAVWDSGLGDFAGVHCDSFLIDRLECSHVDIYGESDNGPPVLGVLLVSESLEQGGDILVELLHVGLAGKLVYGDIRLGAHVHAGAALTVKIVQALKTLLAACAVGVELALTGLKKHALGHDGSAHSLIAGGGEGD